MWGVRQTPSPKEVERDIEMRRAFNKARSEWVFEAHAKIKAFRPKGAPWRIRERDDGQYVIERRGVKSSLDFDPNRILIGTPTQAEIDLYSKHPPVVWEWYEIVPGDHGAALSFNVYADAEAYLRRMTRVRPNVVEFDHPPLTKRVKAKEKPQ